MLRRTAITAIATLACTTVSAKSWLETIEDLNDYSSEAGTLKLVSSSPLKFEIFQTDAAKQQPAYKAEAVNRAAIYGIYRTFIHTDVPELEVAAGLLEMHSAVPRVVKPNPQYKVVVRTTREQALKAISSLLPEVKSFQDLVAKQTVGGLVFDDLWTDAFDSVYLKGSEQAKLLKALNAKTSYGK